jgi:hypothetical protein
MVARSELPQSVALHEKEIEVRREKAAGDIIETNCTKCKALTNHTIVAMVNGLTVKVECNVCHSSHKYHPPKEAKAARSPAVPKAPRAATAAPRRMKKDPVEEAIAEWAELQSSLDPERARPYEMTAVYRVKSLLAHPTFGLGVVQKVLPPNKIEVLFKEGRKLLRCG